MNLFEAKTVKSYISARIAALPGHGRGEARRIASHLDVSTTLISHILSGERLLTSEQAEKLAEYWGLRSTELDYFMALIYFERAGTKALQDYWKTKLEKIKAESKILSNRVPAKKMLSEQERSVFYSNALFSSVRLYLSTSEKGFSLDEIAKRFELSNAAASKIIEFLTETGLAEESKGRFKMGAQSTHVGVDSPHLVRHHTNWRLKALQYAKDLDESELMFTSPVSLSKEDFQKIREKMVVVIKDFLAEVKASPAEEIACLNLDFFWIKK
jgi:uncharacterized protein (TIGR02147 family)